MEAKMKKVDVPIIRDLLFQISSDAGEVSKLLADRECFATRNGNMSEEEGKQRTDISSVISMMLSTLVEISSLLSINLQQACCRKIELNSKKYPVELSKVRNSDW
jgi:hypothetical protein